MDLRPCPFCGGNATMREYKFCPSDDSRYWVNCDECGAEQPSYQTEEEAAEMWNRRIIADCPTIYSFDVKELITFAGEARKAGITPADLHEMFGNAKSAYEYLRTEFDEQTKRFIADLVESAKDYECNVRYRSVHKKKEKDDG